MILTFQHIKQKMYDKFNSMDCEVFKENCFKERLVYHISDARGQSGVIKYHKITDVGILITSRFYFIFDYYACFDRSDNTLDFSKLQCLIEMAHGCRESGILTDHDPFTPPKGDWDILWAGPHGSVLNNYTTESILETRLFGVWSRKNKNVEIFSWNDANGNPQNNYSDHIREGKKFSDMRKLVSGTISHSDKIMNYGLSAYKKDDGHPCGAIDYAISTVQCTNNLGFVITRNRYAYTTTLEDLLKSIKKYNFPNSLVVASCRSYYDYKKDKPSPVWGNSYSAGPYIHELFNLSVPAECISSSAPGRNPHQWTVWSSLDK